MIITTKENYDEVLKKSDEAVKFVMKNIYKRDVKCFGKKLVIIESKFEADQKYDNHELEPFSILDNFIEKLSKDKKNFIRLEIEGPSL